MNVKAYLFYNGIHWLMKSMFLCFTVNVGDYIEAVLDRNLAENISRVLYPNDNVSLFIITHVISNRPITFCVNLSLLEQTNITN